MSIVPLHTGNISTIVANTIPAAGNIVPDEKFDSSEYVLVDLTQTGNTIPRQEAANKAMDVHPLVSAIVKGTTSYLGFSELICEIITNALGRPLILAMTTYHMSTEEQLALTGPPVQLALTGSPVQLALTGSPEQLAIEW